MTYRSDPGYEWDQSTHRLKVQLRFHASENLITHDLILDLIWYKIFEFEIQLFMHELWSYRYVKKIKEVQKSREKLLVSRNGLACSLRTDKDTDTKHLNDLSKWQKLRAKIVILIALESCQHLYLVKLLILGFLTNCLLYNYVANFQILTWCGTLSII